MQVVRLVEAGLVDKMIAFDSLPERLFRNVKTKTVDGFHRYWKRWLEENGSSRSVTRTVDQDGTKETTIEYYTYILDYKDVNADKESWQAITSHVRRAVDLKTRLKDKIEDMAEPLASDSKTEMTLEPENVEIILIPKELKVVEEAPVIIRPSVGGESVSLDEVAEAPRKRGRQKKVTVEA